MFEGVPKNRFKERLTAGELQYGVFCALTDPSAGEILGACGFDWIMIDSEHAPHDLRSIAAQLPGIEASGASALVRPEANDVVRVKRLLDLGVQTVVVPMVESAEQAIALAQCVRYPPHGTRGVGTSMARAARWNRIAGYDQGANAEMCVVAQIESVDGVANVESIAAVDGIDALFVGPSDLAASMGFLGRPDRREVVEQVDEAIARIRSCGKPAGVFAANPELAERWIAAGATFVALGSDVAMLVKAASSLVVEARNR